VYAHPARPLPRQGFRRSEPGGADAQNGLHGTSMAHAEPLAAVRPPSRERRGG